VAEAQLFDAQQIIAQGSGPPVSPGHVRLFRAEVRPEVRRAAPEWVAAGQRESGMAEAEGRWFVADRSMLDFYVKDIGAASSRIVYVDVPLEVAEAHRVSNLKEEIAGRTPASFSRDPENEFFLPRNIADRKQPWLAAYETGPKIAVGVNDEGQTVYRKASDVLAEAEEEVKAANRVRNCAVGSSI
jgi:hypothetical protein